MANRPPHILVGHSVRYLAQSARRAGLPVVAVDAFGDTDTLAAAGQIRRVARPSPADLGRGFVGLDIGADATWSYGAGFESAPDSLAAMRRRRLGLLGSAPAVLRLLAHPTRLFALLNDLDIPVPEIAWQRPAHPDGWLFKNAGSQGGNGVWRVAEAPGTARGYYQRYLPGPVHSLLFAADGKAMRGIAYNRLEPRDARLGDFRFNRVLGDQVPPTPAAEQMQRAAVRLTRTLGLRGVNGLDFVLQQDRALLLDINARPPASLELYESLLPGGGLATHLAACRGRLPAPLPAGRPGGLQIVYAEQDTPVGAPHWPDWARDRPRPGSLVRAGDPLCSVHARADEAACLSDLLEQRALAAQFLIAQSNGVAA